LSYFESRLRVNFNDFKEIKEKLELCEKLGIKNLILEPKERNHTISLEQKKFIKNFTKMDISYRYTLKPENLQDFKKKIKRFNNRPEIVSVETSNKDIQIHAARDSRVDLISFSTPEVIKTLTNGVISLVKQKDSFIEFSLSSLMVKNRAMQSKNFRNLYRFIHKVRNLKVNYILTGDFNDLYDIRHPRALISICNTLLDIPIAELKRVFRENPVMLLKRSYKKQDNTILENGVRLIGNGDL
jgi:RNase P/RNase MRP subunit p30